MNLSLDKGSWKRVTLGEVAVASKERVDPRSGDVDRYVAGEHMDTDDLTIHRWGRVGDGYLGPAFHRRFHSGQILYGSRRTYLRKVAVADFGGVTANTTFVVETRDASVLKQEFLPFIMSSEPFHAFAIRESKGSVNPYVNWSDIALYEFDLPSLDEQDSLAALHWSVERHTKRLQAVDAALAPAYDAWVVKRLAEFPTRPLGEVVALQNGRPVPSELYGKGEFPLLRPGDLPPDGIARWSASSVAIPESFAAQYADWILQPGDLVINMTAQSLEDRFLGRVCKMHERALLNQRIGRLRSSEVENEYLFVALRSPVFTAWVERRSEGSKVKHMHWRHIEDFPLPVPDKRMREAIVAERNAWSSTIAKLNSEKVTARSLYSSLSAASFEGAK